MMVGKVDKRGLREKLHWVARRAGVAYLSWVDVYRGNDYICSIPAPFSGMFVTLGRDQRCRTAYPYLAACTRDKCPACK